MISDTNISCNEMHAESRNNSAVGIVAKQRIVQSSNRGSMPAGTNYTSFPKNPRPVLSSSQPSDHWVSGVLSP